MKKAERTRKPEKGKYWIVTRVIMNKPYYLTDVEEYNSKEKAGVREHTYTWNPGAEGMRGAVIFLNEEEAWDTAYSGRGTVITKYAGGTRK